MFDILKQGIKKITIRKKIMLLMFLLLLVVFSSLYGIFYTSMERMLSQREDDNIKNQLMLTQEILYSSLDYLPNITKSWSAWDNTYEFVKGNFDQFVKYSLNDYPYATYNLDFITILDLNGYIIYEKFNANSLLKNDLSPINLALVYKKLGPLTAATFQEKGALGSAKNQSTGFSGFVGIGNQLVYISSQPISRDNKTGPCVGSLLFGRIIDNSQLNYLKEESEIVFTIQNKEEINLSTEQWAILESSTLVLNDKDFSTAYSQFRDIFGKNDLILSTSSPRYLYKDGLAFITNTLIILALFCLLSFFIVLKFTQVVVLKPLALFKKGTDDSDDKDDFK